VGVLEYVCLCVYVCACVYSRACVHVCVYGRSLVKRIA